MLIMKKFILTLLSLTLMGSVQAKEKDVEIIVQFTAGGNADRIARVIDKYVDKQRYITRFTYKPGAGGSIGHNALLSVTRANETAIMIGGNSLTTLPVMDPATNQYSPSSFLAVANIGFNPSIMVVNSASGMKTYKDFVAFSRNNPVSYGSSGVGGAGHIVAAAIANNQKNFVHVPYKGPAIADLVSGQLTYIVESPAIVEPMIRAGKLTPIAINGPVRLAEYPSVPTLKELGVNDYDYYRWFVLIANKSADPETVAYFRKLLTNSDLQRDLKSEVEIQPFPSRLTPEEFLRAEQKKFDTINKDLVLKQQ